MTLKQLTNLDRINFLKKFTTELMINATEQQKVEKNIKIEKLKQKFVRPRELPEQAFRKIMKTSIFEPSRGLEERQKIKKQRIEQIENFEEKKKMQKLQELKENKFRLSKTNLTEKLRRPIFHRAKTPKQIPIRKPKKSFLKRLKPIIKLKKSPSIQKPIPSRPPAEDIRKVNPEAEPRPVGFALGRIEQFLRDPSIQLIECPGPGKNLLIGKLSKVNITNTSLSQEEITDIIHSFSNQARIPIMGGILKAAVGDMIISAVISEYVGSRFIIRKITPYSLLQEQIPQR
jgi:hypothetical protein